MKKKTSLAISLAVLVSIPLFAFAAEKSHQEVKGIIQSMPAKNIGSWKIDGKEVKVSAQTQIDEKECKLKVGGMAEAEGHFQGKILVATKIECEAPEGSEEHEDQDAD